MQHGIKEEGPDKTVLQGQIENTHNKDPQKKHCLGTVSKQNIGGLKQVKW